MKTFCLTLLSLLCLVGGLYAQEEPVNDTVYLTSTTNPVRLELTISQWTSTGLYIDWGDGDVEWKSGYKDIFGDKDTTWEIEHFYSVLDEHQIKLFVRSGNLKSRLLSLDCYKEHITELDVSDCIALKELRCSGNDLTSLDVSGCIALKRLFCDDNDLTSLDVSGCTSLGYLEYTGKELKRLNASGCDVLRSVTLSGDIQLTSLNLENCKSLEYIKNYWNSNVYFKLVDSVNVHGCTSLEELYCSSEQLKWLDVRGCAALKTLYCSNAQLTSLDLEGCTSLDELRCSENQLTSLDVSECTDMRKLYCNNNQLTSLNVTGCKAFEHLDCSNNQLATSLDLADCTALWNLYCQNNQLTSLNVTGCKAFKYLDCGNNQLASSLDLAGCTALYDLACDSNQLTSLDLTGCTALRYVYCQSNRLTSLDLTGCTALRYVYCQRNRLTSLDVIGLYGLNCSENSIPLAKLPTIQTAAGRPNWWRMSPQAISMTLKVGDTLDMSAELKIRDTATKVTCEPNDGFRWHRKLLWFLFEKAGDYVIQLSNEAVRELVGDYYIDTKPANVYYYISVSGSEEPIEPEDPETPDNPDKPEEPVEPADPVAPEDPEEPDNPVVVVPDVEAPVFSVPSGAVRRGTEVVISCATEGTAIFYTLDDKDYIYSEPIRIDHPVTISAMAFELNGSNKWSKATVATYTIDETPNESTLSAATLRVYAQDRTIYLSEPAGEVEVFTVSGRRVYRGVSTVIPVPRPGLYVVSAAGRKYKVVVK